MPPFPGTGRGWRAVWARRKQSAGEQGAPSGRELARPAAGAASLPAAGCLAVALCLATGLCLTAATVLEIKPGPAAGAYYRASDPQGAAVLDGFEDPFWPDPSLWRLPADTTPMWWPSSCQAHSGRRSLWAFGGPTLGGEQPCDASSPPGTSNVIVMNLDLRQAVLASRLDLYFALWLAMPPGEGQGLFIHLLVPRPSGGYERVPVFGATATTGRWSFPLRRLDLLALVDIGAPERVYDLRGGFWRLEWTALAPSGTPPGGGIFVDDLTLVWEPDPAVPEPTPRLPPTLTPSPSPSPLPTSSPRPTQTAPVATAVPSPEPVYLPHVVRQHPESTATPEPTASPTPEPLPPTAEPT